MARLGKSCTNACNLHPLIKLDLLDLFFGSCRGKMGAFFIIYNYLEIVFNGNGMSITCTCNSLICISK